MLAAREIGRLLLAERLTRTSHDAAQELNARRDKLLDQIQGGVDDGLAPRLIGDHGSYFIDELAQGLDRSLARPASTDSSTSSDSSAQPGVVLCGVSVMIELLILSRCCRCSRYIEAAPASAYLTWPTLSPSTPHHEWLKSFAR